MTVSTKHLSFVKYIDVVAKNLTRKGRNMTNSYHCDIYMHSEYKFAEWGKLFWLPESHLPINLVLRFEVKVAVL